jgi:spore maturation protein CgeD
MHEKVVSVILTSYNKPVYLKRAIESVLSQTYKNFELIIADDNSPNQEVWEVINSYNDSRIIKFNSYVKEKYRLLTARYATQINFAVRQFSSGELLTYLADDDFYYPEMLERMVNFINHKNVDVAFCAQHILDEDGNIDGGGIEGRGIRFFNEVLVRGADKLDHNQVMNTRSAYDRVDGWDDSPGAWSGADAYFFDRLENHGYKFYPIDYDKPLQAKMYRKNSVQWNMTNGLLPTE